MSDGPVEPTVGDAFGGALLEYLERGSAGRGPQVERDDGLSEFIDPDHRAGTPYLAVFGLAE